jgi:hypothetical protein
MGQHVITLDFPLEASQTFDAGDPVGFDGTSGRLEIAPVATTLVTRATFAGFAAEAATGSTPASRIGGALGSQQADADIGAVTDAMRGMYPSWCITEFVTRNVWGDGAATTPLLPVVTDYGKLFSLAQGTDFAGTAGVFGVQRDPTPGGDGAVGVRVTRVLDIKGTPITATNGLTGEFLVFVVANGGIATDQWATEA